MSAVTKLLGEFEDMNLTSAAPLTAAQKALSLPELLHRIFKKLEDKDKASLAAAARVNKLWAIEAVRSLWAYCGLGFSTRDVTRCPKFQNLGQIQGLERRQWYASQITDLCPGFHGISGMSMSRNTPTLPLELRVWEKVGSPLYEEHFGSISFPNLRSLRLKYPMINPGFESSRTIAKYLGPLLRELYLETPQFAPGFFSLFETTCPNLRELVVILASQDARMQIPAKEFSSCIRRMRSLQKLRVSIPLHSLNPGLWSEDAFLALASHPSIRMLAIPKTPLSWMETINGEDPAAFQKLSFLSADLSEDAFEEVVQLAKHLKELRLRVLGTSRNVCAIAARLVELRELYVSFEEPSKLHSEDLLNLAAACPLKKLTYGSLDQDFGQEPVGVGINDEVMDKVAMHLPNMKLFRLHLNRRETRLSEKTLLSLAKWCKGIWMIMVHVTVDWDKLARLEPKEVFPQLRVLNLLDLSMSGTGFCRDVTKLATNIRVLAPKLRDLVVAVREIRRPMLTLRMAWKTILDSERTEVGRR